MPEAKFTRVVSVSGELLPHCAAGNLLKPGAYTKWLCPKGSSQASVVLQLESSCKIVSIDIGNYGSAFVEILVGRAEKPDDYQVILPASSLMSLSESRRFSSPDTETGASSTSEGCRVKMVTGDKLAPGAKDENWDRVKIVCTQPFNKNIDFGLSFVRMIVENSAPSQEDKTEKKKEPDSIGGIKLRSFDEDDISSGGKSNSIPKLFAKRASLGAGSDVSTGSDKPKPKIQSAPVTQKPVKPVASQKYGAKTAQVEKAQRKSSEKVPEKTPTETRVQTKEQKKSSEKVSEKPLPVTQLQTKNVDQAQSSNVSKLTDEPQSSTGSKKGNKDDKSHTGERRVPFSQLMSDVTFVLSGFENPFRGELRQKGVAMGATYAPNWVKNNCTHLICAFANTPKHRQVKNDRGKVVRKEWIEDSYKQKMRFHWRKYALDSSDSASDFSDEELISDEIKAKHVRQAGLTAQRQLDYTAVKERDETSPPPSKRRRQSADPDYNDPDSGSKSTQKTESYGDSGSGSDVDTDGEIERIQRKNDRKDKTGENGAAGDKTEPSENGTHNSNLSKHLDVGNDGLPVLPDFFDGCTFFIYGSMDNEARKRIQREIYAYCGEIRLYMGSDVTHVVSGLKKCNTEMINSRNDYPQKFVFVTPNFVYDSVKFNSKVNESNYLISE